MIIIFKAKIHKFSPPTSVFFSLLTLHTTDTSHISAGYCQIPVRTFYGPLRSFCQHNSGRATNLPGRDPTHHRSNHGEIFDGQNNPDPVQRSPLTTDSNLTPAFIRNSLCRSCSFVLSHRLDNIHP